MTDLRAASVDVTSNGAPADWRRRLLHGIGWTLLVKLIALILLKQLFFSAGHRVQVTPELLETRLLAAPAPTPEDAR